MAPLKKVKNIRQYVFSERASAWRKAVVDISAEVGDLRSSRWSGREIAPQQGPRRVHSPRCLMMNSRIVS
jgi:hypothetical protein